MIEETLTVGEAVTVVVEVAFIAAKTDETFPAAKSEATGPLVGNPVKEDP